MRRAIREVPDLARAYRMTEAIGVAEIALATLVLRGPVRRSRQHTGPPTPEHTPNLREAGSDRPGAHHQTSIDTSFVRSHVSSSSTISPAARTSGPGRSATASVTAGVSINGVTGAPGSARRVRRPSRTASS